LSPKLYVPHPRRWVKALAATPYSVGYVGVSFRDAIKTAGFGTAPMKNQNGKFVLPNAQTITAAGASELDRRTPPDQRLSLVYARGAPPDFIRALSEQQID
jgi:phosphate transport system substrate-binding protein